MRSRETRRYKIIYRPRTRTYVDAETKVYFLAIERTTAASWQKSCSYNSSRYAARLPKRDWFRIRWTVIQTTINWPSRPLLDLGLRPTEVGPQKPMQRKSPVQ